MVFVEFVIGRNQTPTTTRLMELYDRAEQRGAKLDVSRHDICTMLPEVLAELGLQPEGVGA